MVEESTGKTCYDKNIAIFETLMGHQSGLLDREMRSCSQKFQTCMGEEGVKDQICGRSLWLVPIHNFLPMNVK